MNTSRDDFPFHECPSCYNLSIKKHSLVLFTLTPPSKGLTFELMVKKSPSKNIFEEENEHIKEQRDQIPSVNGVNLK